MSVISQKLPAPIGGVSQQPDSLKLPNQLRECDDFFPDPTFGLAKRPGLKAVKVLSGASSEGSSWFQVIRDDEERYVIQVARNGVVKIWDADSGQAQTVNTPDPGAAGYATHTKDDDIEIFQINDYILLLNRTKVVQKSNLLSGSRTPYAIVSINTVAYNSEYKVQLDSTIYTYQTASSSTTRLSVEDIVSGLVTTINAGGTFTAMAIASYLYIVKNDNAAFRINARGGAGGSALEAYYEQVSSPAELPRQFFHNATMRVLGPEGGDDYWVIFKVANGGTSGAGAWEETIAPTVRYTYNISTLPHAIIREANGTFTFRSLTEAYALAQTVSATVNGVVGSASVTTNTKGFYAAGVSFWVTGGAGTGLRLRVTSTDANGRVTGVEVSRGGSGYAVNNVVTNEYGDTFTVSSVHSATSYADRLGTQFYQPRLVGDDTTNEYPSFVDKTISGISFFKNRLIFMSGENVICSTVGDYFNFFQSTVVTVVDNDPIDLSCGSLIPVDLRYAIGTSRGLLLFADNAQYVLETRTEAFSAATAEINQVGSYDMSTSIAPVDMGPTIAFLDQGQRSCTVFEMLVGADSATKPQIAELTRTIPSYLPSYVSRMKASSSASTLAIHSLREPENLYLFRFYNLGTERQQAAWFRWTFPGTIKSFNFENDLLRVILVPTGQTLPVLVNMSLITETTAAPLEFENVPIDVRLDFYTYNPLVAYHAGSDTTRIYFPEGFGNQADTAVAVKTGATEIGSLWEAALTYDVGAPASQKYYLSVPGDQTTFTWAIGFKYTARAVMPAFFVLRDERKDTLNVPVVQRLYLDSYNSGPYRVNVASQGRAEYIAALPQVVADFSLLDALPLLRNAQNVVPIMSRGDQVDVTIECPHPFPTTLNGLTWTGLYNNRGIRPV